MQVVSRPTPKPRNSWDPMLDLTPAPALAKATQARQVVGTEQAAADCQTPDP